MSIEVFLFLVVGGLAVAAAASMLITDNAVYSALFLILNFGCVAFLYLMLDAPFLAMVQIAVYAGAIMVLFLFVIMLLGAERDPEGDNKSFQWLAPTAMGLALALVIASGLAFFAGEIDDQPIPEDVPQIRLAHLAPRFLESGDVYLNGELFAEGVEFGETTGFEALEPGDYSLAIDGDHPQLTQPFPLGNITLAEGDVRTIILYGASAVFGGGDSGVPELGLPEILDVAEDVNVVEANSGRVTFINTYTGAEAIDLVDAGSNFRIDDNEEIEVIAAGIASGEALDPQIFRSGSPDWMFTVAGDNDQVLARLRDYEIENETTQLLVLAERIPAGATEAVPFVQPVTVDSRPAFGSPEAIGQSLFIDYVLPFQLVAMLLLAAMVGVIVLTQRAGLKPKPGRPLRRKVSRPLTSVISSQTGHDVLQPSQPQLEAPDGERPEPAGD